MAKIQYTDKADLVDKPDVAPENKVSAADMNEIKQVVNTNADLIGGIREVVEITTPVPYDLTDADNGKLIKIFSASGNVIRAQGMSAGFKCEVVIQSGNGTVTFIPSGNFKAPHGLIMRGTESAWNVVSIETNAVHIGPLSNNQVRPNSQELSGGSAYFPQVSDYETITRFEGSGGSPIASKGVLEFNASYDNGRWHEFVNQTGLALLITISGGATAYFNGTDITANTHEIKANGYAKAHYINNGEIYFEGDLQAIV